MPAQTPRESALIYEGRTQAFREAENWLRQKAMRAENASGPSPETHRAMAAAYNLAANRMLDNQEGSE